MKVSQLPLNELYEKKITAAVEAAIHEKENFTQISQTYCEKVCKLKCKNPGKVSLLDTPVDILIVQDHMAPNGKFDKRPGQQESVQRNIISLLGQRAEFSGLTVRLTSLLKCDPSELDFVRGKSPTTTVISKCKPYLFEEIRRCKPKVILSLSTSVTKALGLKSHSNTGNRGHVVESKYGPVVISLHPRILSMIRQTAVGASGFWSADYFEVVRRDFAKAALLARGLLTVPTLNAALDEAAKRITVCYDLDSVTKHCREILALPPNSLVSWDLETTGLNGFAEDAKILCCQFGYKPTGETSYKSVVFPLWHKANTWFDPDVAWSYITPILTGPTKKSGWNVKFDCVYCAGATGVRPENIVLDGLLATHLLDSGANGTFSLKAAVSDFMPESGLQGYEDLLPKLGSKMPETENMQDE